MLLAQTCLSLAGIETLKQEGLKDWSLRREEEAQNRVGAVSVYWELRYQTLLCLLEQPCEIKVVPTIPALARVN